MPKNQIHKERKNPINKNQSTETNQLTAAAPQTRKKKNEGKKKTTHVSNHQHHNEIGQAARGHFGSDSHGVRLAEGAKHVEPRRLVAELDELEDADVD